MHPKAQELFEELCELSDDARQQRMAAVAANDVVLADEVRSLLKSYETAGEFLADATAAFDGDGVDTDSPFVNIAERPGDTIGRYRLLEQIGEGGFGQVFMAQQSEPVRRRVALKIIKLGMDTGQTLARFEAERQALAMMDHPNIAQVFDGGSTETGRPYFVMELVRGEPITNYCDRIKMPTTDRLNLFRQVCRAIEHAHQKGVVHRDIKPSNVLVTVSDDKPLVKVIDFGIAKALNTELTERTLFTEFRQLIGTPQYMSPEQAERSGVDIDTRSDIYSLGVLLYEILTGATPVDPKRLESAAWGQWQKMISEEEPKRPSDHISATMETVEDVASQRSVSPKDLAGTLRGDLDWIVLKSLEKDRSRRYATASQFEEDIDRYLSDQVVLATPPDRIYQFRRFLKRNRSTVLFAGLLLSTLLIGLVGTSVAALWALRERDAARMARNGAEDARVHAEESTARVQRLSALAVSPYMNREAAQRLIAEWEADIDRMKRSSGAENPIVVRMECQRIGLMHQLAQQYNDGVMAKQAWQDVQQLLPRASKVLDESDANRMALLNSAVQLSGQHGAKKGETAKLYGQLIWVMGNVQGRKATRLILPEYAALTGFINWHQKAEDAINNYLELAEGEEIPDNEFARLNRAVDQLARWGVDHSEVYERFRSFRDNGVVIDESKSEDRELAADQNTLQGKWVSRDESVSEMWSQLTIQAIEPTLMYSTPMETLSVI